MPEVPGAPKGLPPGTYDAFVLACEWTDLRGLEFDVTLLAGDVKGEVVTFVVPREGVATVRRVFGLHPGHIEPSVDIVGLPCDLVVREGGIGFA